MNNLEIEISKRFRLAFEHHPDRENDPALALASARETASAFVPEGRWGTFDDEALTFRQDSRVVVVTRHPGLIEYLRTLPQFENVITDKTPVLDHVDDEFDIADADVVGVLPMHLASHANTITEIPLALTKEDRGKELSCARLREIAGAPVTYVVRTVEIARLDARRYYDEGVYDGEYTTRAPENWNPFDGALSAARREGVV